MEGDIPGRPNGVLVSMAAGRAVAFGLDGLQERAEMFVGPGDVVYEGMIVGENSRTGDMSVNPTKEKKLTNMRAAGSDRNILLKPPRVLSLEAALEYIEDDELVEVTPHPDPPPQDHAQGSRPPPRRPPKGIGISSLAQAFLPGAPNGLKAPRKPPEGD